MSKNYKWLKLFQLEYVKTAASMVIVKESNILEVWYLAFPKFFLCVLNKFDKNNERKQAHKKQRKAKKQKKTKNKKKTIKKKKKKSRSNIKIADDILHLMKFLVNTDKSTHPIIIQTIEIYNSKID